MRAAVLPACSRAIAAGLLCLMAGGGVQAQLFADDDARKAILDLRTRIAQSEEQARARNAELSEQLQALRRNLLEMNNQLEAVRGEMARLRGGNEQLLRDVSELQRKQRDIGQAVDDRLRKVEPQKVTLDGKEFSAEPEEKRQYDEAITLLRAGDLDKASLALANFLKRWPASGYRRAARFWQGSAVWQARLQGSHRGLPRLSGQGARERACARGAAGHRQQPGRDEGQGGRAQDARRAAQGLSQVRGCGRRQGTPRVTEVARAPRRSTKPLASMQNPGLPA
jgi:hypothetical protein